MLALPVPSGRRLAFVVAACVALSLGGRRLRRIRPRHGARRVLIGSHYADSIRDKGGEDIDRGISGNDKPCGGYSRDRFYAYGGPGDDNTYAKDRRFRARWAPDVIKCGPNLDNVEHDDRDRAAGDCERHVEGFPYGSS